MEAKISITLGDIQVSYEGEGSYLNDKLVSLLTTLVDLYRKCFATVTIEESGDVRPVAAAGSGLGFSSSATSGISPGIGAGGAGMMTSGAGVGASAGGGFTPISRIVTRQIVSPTKASSEKDDTIAALQDFKKWWKANKPK